MFRKSFHMLIHSQNSHRYSCGFTQLLILFHTFLFFFLLLFVFFTDYIFYRSFNLSNVPIPPFTTFPLPLPPSLTPSLPLLSSHLLITLSFPVSLCLTLYLCVIQCLSVLHHCFPHHLLLSLPLFVPVWPRHRDIPDLDLSL